MVTHVVAGFVARCLEVQAIDGVDVSVVVPVQLLTVPVVDSYRPELEHLFCGYIGEASFTRLTSASEVKIDTACVGLNLAQSVLICFGG